VHILPPMGGGLRSLVAIVCLMLWPGFARAEVTRVSIDWQGVRDRDIERCGLSRLRAGTIERLVSEGYALVERVDGSGVAVAIQSSTEGLTIRAASGELERQDELRPGEPCDATFVLDVIARVAELVEEVASARPAALVEAAPAVEPNAAPQAESEDAGSRFIGALDVTGRANQALSWLLGGGLSGRVAHASGLQLGGRVELGAASHLEVSVLELYAAVIAAYQPRGNVLGPCAELGPVVHLASSDARSVAKLDAGLGAGLQLSAGHFLAQLLIYGRLGTFEHRVRGEIAHDSGRVGLALRLGAQL
jgi:hypothetical protein